MSYYIFEAIIFYSVLLFAEIVCYNTLNTRRDKFERYKGVTYENY